jgi:hypothetical protein
VGIPTYIGKYRHAAASILSAGSSKDILRDRMITDFDAQAPQMGLRPPSLTLQ